ncbi:MAG: hypothetical protein WC091_10290, partial [Sulfuricellaceae bacterium]
MSITNAARAQLLKTLVGIARNGDAAGLQSLLCGVGLPALSRDDEPALQIHEALLSSDKYADSAKSVAKLLARLIRQRMNAPAQQIDDDVYVYNLFLLATRLPRVNDLFEGLLSFHETGFGGRVTLANARNRAGAQLQRALAEQQPDARLRDYWMGLLRQGVRDWNPARRTELLEAWWGLLNTLDFENAPDDATTALDDALRTLHDSVEGHPEGLGLLQLALWRLDSAFPLDSATWVGMLAPYWKQWPELLQDIAAECWPALHPQARDDMPLLPDNLSRIWESLEVADRGKFRDILRRNAAEDGRQFLKSMIFHAPQVVGMTPQEVRAGLKKLGEHLWPAENKAHPAFPQHETGEREDAEPTRRHAKRPSFDRIAHLEIVNRTLSEIERRLGEGDEAVARRYLDELLEQQRGSPLADQHVHTAKTLAKAAAIVQRFGKLEWAESLLRTACKENHDDNISACGLADVLKARGELEAAEVQYRQNVARWPNDEVPACGLADVLKARGELEAAEVQYRQNVERWPNNEVSACGLADVLKARGELEAAEAQYRQNV